MGDGKYTIGQVVERTEIPRTAIDWYIREKLIRVKDRVGLYRMFDDETIDKLEHIKRLRSCTPEFPNGMPLRQIRTALEQMETGS